MTHQNLIVNADDFGFSEGVSKGIIRAHLEGIVTTASGMVNMDTFASALQIQQSMAPDLELGLHINLTVGKPVSNPEQIGSLVSDRGYFDDTVRRCPRKIDAEHVEIEIRAQFDKFVKLTGTVPCHLNSHQYIGNFLPSALQVITTLASDNNIYVRCPMVFADHQKFVQFCEIMKISQLDYRVAHFIEYSHQQSLRNNEELRFPNFFEYRFYGNGAKIDNLLYLLKHLPEGTTELMCHPGYERDLNDEYNNRELELDILTDSRVLETIEEMGINLCRFGNKPKEDMCSDRIHNYSMSIERNMVNS